jgi:arginyl-tRNA synthetase
LLRTFLASVFRAALTQLVEQGRLPNEVLNVRIEIADPKNPEHGDFACNIAMTASKLAGKNPREFAEMLVEAVSSSEPIFEKVEIAGPGFINLTLNSEFVAAYVETINSLSHGDLAKQNPAESPFKINVEFVSVNPNGPITIGSGRGAAYGSTLCNIFEAAGHTVHREYYINDGVNSEQMRLFAESVRALIKGESVPENGYKGDYVHDVAKELQGQNLESAEVVVLQKASEQKMIEAQRTALAAFGVNYDTWFSEQSLHDAGTVAAEIDSLAAKGIANTDPTRTKLKLAKGGKIEDVIIESQTADVDDEGEVQQAEATAEGETLWLRSTKLGDDMDRVLLRKDGRLTYIASDVAYHKDKFNRPAGADKLITILGPDHHGYIGRLTAVVAAMLLEPSEKGEPCTDELDAKLYRDENEKAACQKALAEAKKRLEVQIYQLVRFMKDGKPAPMRKRDGNIYALIDLMREIGTKLKPEGSEAEQLESGKDVARFFYLMRSHDTTFDFDLDLAEKQSDENPVFYVQYAHARICSILEKAGEQGEANLALLTHPKEKTLIKRIADLPNEVSRAAEDYGVHRLTTYAIELARAFHGFYGDCKVISEDKALSAARVQLCQATKKALKETLGLLGVSAPERM